MALELPLMPIKQHMRETLLQTQQQARTQQRQAKQTGEYRKNSPEFSPDYERGARAREPARAQLRSDRPRLISLPCTIPGCGGRCIVSEEDVGSSWFLDQWCKSCTRADGAKRATWDTFGVVYKCACGHFIEDHGAPHLPGTACRRCKCEACHKKFPETPGLMRTAS